MKTFTTNGRIACMLVAILLTTAVTRLQAQCIAGELPTMASMYTGIAKLGADTLFAQQVTVTNGGTLGAIGSVAALANGSRIKMALYTNNAGTPGSLIVETNSDTLIPKGQFYLPVTPTCISPGSYWTVWVSNAPARLATTTVGGAGNTVYAKSSAYGSTFPASYGTAGASAGIKYYAMLKIWCQTSPPVPLLTASKRQTCSGDAVILSDTSNSATSLEWFTGSCGGTSIGTGASITVMPTATTTYYARASGCGLANVCASITITVNSPATVWYRDADGDGYGDINNTFTGCTPPSGYVAGSCDPDDNNPLAACRDDGQTQYACDIYQPGFSIINGAGCVLGEGMTTINVNAFADYNLIWNIVGPDGQSSWKGAECNSGNCGINETFEAEPGSYLHIVLSGPCYHYGSNGEASFSGGTTFEKWLPSCETTVHPGGFTCGLYKINRPQDRFTELFIDGKLIWRDSIVGSERKHWYGELNASSEVIFRTFNPKSPLNTPYNSAILDTSIITNDSLSINTSASQICLGQLVTLSTNLASETPLDFVWSNGATGPSIQVPPGTYSVSTSVSCAQLVSGTVGIDTIRPVITSCPANMVVPKSPGICGAFVNFETPYAFVPCPGSAVISDSIGYVGAYQTWVVPAKVFYIEVVAAGSNGNGSGVYEGGVYGAGAVVKTTMAVTSGETLYLNVGGIPYNGGGLGYLGSTGAGGGLTSIGRTGNRLTDTLVVAGGGGGIGQSPYPIPATNGGGNDGLNLSQRPDLAGQFMQGGDGWTEDPSSGYVGSSGGGGGGYFGGQPSRFSGGQAGSSYVTPVGTSNTVYQGNTNAGLGYVKISYYVQQPMVQTAGLPSGSEFPLGTTRVTFAPAQTTGAKDSCSFTITVTGGNTWYYDADNDGHYQYSVTSCTSPGAGFNQTATTLGDCNDSDPTVFTPTIWYLDADNDGHYQYTVTSCIRPSVAYNQTATILGDCNDYDPAVFEATNWYLDADNDGHAAQILFSCSSPGTGYTTTSMPEGDCNDNDATTWNRVLGYIDVDGDGYTVGGMMFFCYGNNLPTGYTTTSQGTDSDDNDPAVQAFERWYLDADKDGHYISSVMAYSRPSADYTNIFNANGNGDCDDTNNTIWRATSAYADADDDRYAGGPQIQLCYGASLPTGFMFSSSNLGSDCDDTNPNIHSSQTWYLDTDNDGYYASFADFCTEPGAGYTTTSNMGEDCDDTDPAINGSQIWYLDADNDGYYGDYTFSCSKPGADYNTTSTLGYDCNDSDATLAEEKAWYIDADNDGYYSSYTYSCSNPGAGYNSTSNLGEDCDDTDPNILGQTTWYIDEDNDGYYASYVNVCSDPGPGYNTTSNLGADCDDTDPHVLGSTIWYWDGDGDGYYTGYTYSCSNPGPGYSTTSNLGDDCNDNDPSIRGPQTWYLDADNDGHYISSQISCGNPGVGYNQTATSQGDCDDADNTKWRTIMLYRDADGDGYTVGSLAKVCYGTTVPVGYRATSLGADCDDADKTKWRTAALYVDADGDRYTIGSPIQVCYGTTIPSGYRTTSAGTDCDDIDNTKWRTAALYVDADGDRYTVGSSVQVCYGTTIPSGYRITSAGTDCDDADNTKWRTAALYVDADGDRYTVGSSVQVCYGATVPIGYRTTSSGTDCDDTDKTKWRTSALYVDADGDRYTVGSSVQVCYGATVPAGYRTTSAGTDCDDADNTKWRTAPLYVDADGDRYTVGTPVQICYGTAVPAGYRTTSAGTDCDDTDKTKWRTTALYVDADGDRYTVGSPVQICYGATVPVGYRTTSAGTDCDDADKTKWRTIALYVDADGDRYTVGSLVQICYGTTIPAGYRTTSLGTDCDDTDKTKWRTSALYVDADGDRYTVGLPVQICYGTTIPAGYRTTSSGTDCNDANVNIRSGAVEICGNGIDDNCNGQVDENCNSYAGNVGLNETKTQAIAISEKSIPSKIIEEKSPVLKVYPNPSSGPFTVELTISKIINTNAKLELIDITGRSVYVWNTAVSNGILQQRVTIPHSASAGLYTIKITIGDKTHFAKLVYEK